VVGTTQSAVSEIETFQTVPRIATLQRYAEACGGRVRVELDLPDVEDEAAETDRAGFNDHAYLAVYDHGIGWAGLDQERVHEYARNTGSAVVALPLAADYRTTPEPS
jgi:transcriptional regulator with XRE-family HTH domain